MELELLEVMSTSVVDPVCSTDNIWRGTNEAECLSDVLDTIENNIATLNSGKANTDHAHDEYSLTTHAHDGYSMTTHTHDNAYATINHTHAGYASANHTHTDYANSTHSHSEYALATDVDALEDKVGDTTVSSQISTALTSKADADHTHTEYASASHSHNEYATAEHTHSGYALENHEHTGYAATSHSHSEYAETNHTHTGFAAEDHTHSGYASVTDVSALQTLVGDAAVSAQISTAIASKADVNHAHTASDVGALPFIDARGAEYDMDTILQSGVHYRAYRVNSTTLGTPYAKGASSFSTGIIISIASSTTTGKQIAYVSGSSCTFERRMYNGTIGDWQSVYNSGYKPSPSDIGAAATSHTHNVFSSLTELGITTFPTTMRTVCTSMPDNTMIIMDTRVINGSSTDYGTETISDWGTTANGVAIILKGVTAARMTMMIMYGTTTATTGQIRYGNYAYESDAVNWDDLDDQLDEKVDKIVNKSGVDLNTLTDPGMYYVSSGSTSLNFPIGVNGHMLVMSDGDGRTRQLFMRLGTANTNNFQWYSRTYHSTTWSNWWLMSGQEKIWNGGAVLNDEINIGSRYGCQSWIVVARLQNTGALASVVIPRAFLTSDTDLYKFQIADETCFISFYIYYKSDNDVYLKVIDQSDNEYTTLKYVYRTT